MIKRLQKEFGVYSVSQPSSVKLQGPVKTDHPESSVLFNVTVTIQFSISYFSPFQFRSEHAEEMEDLVDVVNDLENKDEELAHLKSFQEAQAAELTQVRKDFHELERNSKATLEKLEYKSKKDLQTANIKVFMY